jgi:predicted nuclease of predicted toxin-antitoxin system
MRFLADECFDARLIVALRDEGNDVFSVREMMAGASDTDILAHAYEEERVLLTEDTDFGELVFRFMLPTVGVILLRLEAAPVSLKLYRLRNVLHDGARILGHFVVIERQQTRSRPLPPLDE